MSEADSNHTTRINVQSHWCSTKWGFHHYKILVHKDLTTWYIDPSR